MDLTYFKQFISKKNIILLVTFFLILFVTQFFDKGLSVGLFMLAVLSGATFFVLNKLGFKDKKIYILFLIVLGAHLGTTLFMHYADFQPFSGHYGDYVQYQKSAVEIEQSFKQGEFSIKNIIPKYPDLFVANRYPFIVAIVYALTMPKEIIGLILNVWLVALTVIFIYFIVLEIRGLEEGAFMIGLVITFYPSYIFNSGLLLKDPLEICFVFLGLLFLIKTIKKFSWYNFFILFLAIFCVTHFRFYIGYALIITFLISWFLFSEINFKHKAMYGFMFVIIFGFVPQFSAGQGYYGFNSIDVYLNSKMVNFYRQTAYSPALYYPVIKNSVTVIAGAKESVAVTTGYDSTFPTGHGIMSYIKSFVYVFLGPFPWQIKNLRQLFALLETIPWYLLLLFVFYGVTLVYKKRIKEAAPLIIFSVIVMVVIAVFDNNYGLIVRIRIPAFISLLCIASLGLNKNNIFYNKIRYKEWIKIK